MDKFEELIIQESKKSDFGSKQDDIQMWYNQEGDCVQFRAAQVATLRKRIDDFLTLYISTEDNKPIGFQLKDIHALFNVYNIDLITVQADYTAKDKRLVSITTLMLKAFAKVPSPTINRISGYSDAINTIPRDASSVEIPVVAA